MSFGDALPWAQLVAAFVTAGATIALFYVTNVLARETKRLSEATARAYVTASLERNRFNPSQVDLILHNSGNAPAFDVKVEAQPPLPIAVEYTDKISPRSSITLLRPAQQLTEMVADIHQVVDQEFDFRVSWRRRPDAEREAIKYVLDMRDYRGKAVMPDPLIEISSSLKKLAASTEALVRNQNRLSQDEKEELWSLVKEKASPASPGNSGPDGDQH